MFQTALFIMVVLAAHDELPQHRHARLVREAAQSYAGWKEPDPVRTATLTEQFQSHLASWPEPLQAWHQVSPYAIAGLGVCSIALVALGMMTWLVARPIPAAIGLREQRIGPRGNKMSVHQV